MTRLDHDCFASYSSLRYLRALDLDCNNTLDDTALGDAATKLERLTLWNSQSFTALGLMFLSNLQHLRFLSYTVASDADLLAFTPRHSLDTIFLSGRALTNECLPYVAKLGVKHLIMRGAAVTDDGVQMLTGLKSVDLMTCPCITNSCPQQVKDTSILLTRCGPDGNITRPPTDQRFALKRFLTSL